MKRALVLCGGGSLGSYEVGAWKYFREAGITFDIVTGTSIGAINGALVAADEFDRAVNLWKQVAADKVMKHGLNFPRDFLQEFDWKKDVHTLGALARSFVKNQGVDISPFMSWVKEAIPVHEVKTSKLTYGIVTTTFPGFKEEDVLMNDVDEKNILDYLHASSACFPVFPVYTFDGKSYIDGGYYNNLPIDFALRLGADEVIAVLLQAVPKVPQHPELMELSCVKTVLPSHDTGSIMDFNVDTVSKNMLLGYLDAAKRFGKYWGYAFAFKPDEDFLKLVDKFDHDLAVDNIYNYFKVRSSLAYEDFTCKTTLDVFIRSLELVGQWLDLDYLKVYSVKGYIKECQTRIRSNEMKKKRDLKHNFGLTLSANERLNFLMCLDHEFRHKKDLKRFTKLIKNSPEVAAVIEMMKLLESLNLL